MTKCLNDIAETLLLQSVDLPSELMRLRVGKPYSFIRVFDRLREIGKWSADADYLKMCLFADYRFEVSKGLITRIKN